MEKPKTFEVAVALNYTAGMSKRNAVLKAVKEYPTLHTEYIDRIRSGGQDSLHVLLAEADRGFKEEYRKSIKLQNTFRDINQYIAYRRNGENKSN